MTAATPNLYLIDTEPPVPVSPMRKPKRRRQHLRLLIGDTGIMHQLGPAHESGGTQPRRRQGNAALFVNDTYAEAMLLVAARDLLKTRKVLK